MRKEEIAAIKRAILCDLWKEGHLMVYKIVDQFSIDLERASAVREALFELQKEGFVTVTGAGYILPGTVPPPAEEKKSLCSACDLPADEHSELQMARCGAANLGKENADLRAKVERMKQALEKIAGWGRVCDEFEVCRHVACQDSCSSTLLAIDILSDLDNTQAS